MRKKVVKIIENVIYILIITPIVIATISIIYQKIIDPDKIPDIFGFKMFVILVDDMDETLKYGDLAITYNKKIDELKENDHIAFRNEMNKVEINRIEKIEGKNPKTFILSTQKYINEDKFEGLTVKRIPKIGKILYDIQEPVVIIIVSSIILGVGGISILIAKKLDKKEQELYHSQ